MYRLYLEKYEPEAHQNKEQPHVKEWLYWKIFTKNLTQVLGIRAVTHVRGAICLKLPSIVHSQEKNAVNCKES